MREILSCLLSTLQRQNDTMIGELVRSLGCRIHFGLDVFGCALVKERRVATRESSPQRSVERQFARMKKQIDVAIKAHIIRGASYLLLLVAGTVMAFFGPEAPTKVSHPAAAGLSFAERVSYQRAIEEVYWRHRIWPKENLNPKPSLDAVMSQVQIEKKVKDYLHNSQALEDYLQRPITGEQLQAEMDRMGRDTKQPEVLHELFDALGNDPFVIAECLVRSVLSERLITSFAHEKRDGRLALAEVGANSQTWKITLANATYKLPTISDAATGCTPDTWTATSTTNAPDGRFSHTAVWTGTEMIIWGGLTRSGALKTGGKYTPSTDSWTATSTTDAPSQRDGHTAVWTGSEMIVWGGANSSGFLNTGGRYNPSTDSWTATSTTDAPSRRVGHTAVWTGSEMIVWSGFTFDGDFKYSNTGGRYNPSSDSWTATSTTDAPGGRRGHTAVWTDSEMIVWGGTNGTDYFDTGGRYNPGTDSWTATSTSNAPTGRQFHTAVWTGSEMIVWGGNGIGGPFDMGGRYNPTTDGWTATSTTNAPTGRILHTAVWTGSEMIVWGGCSDNDCLMVSNTGGRYNPGADSWTAASTTNAPTARSAHTGVWTDSEMIVWGGEDASFAPLNSGGRYCAQSGAPTPTPTPGPLQLRAQQQKVGGINTVRLNWRYATSPNIDIYRNNVLIATQPNEPGVYTDSTGDTGRAQYRYMVCEAGTQTCSNEVLVRFPR
jgi:N-acetylneuraminic acid mutarotase